MTSKEIEPDIKQEKTSDIDNSEIDNFDDCLCEIFDGKLLRGIYDYGFTEPSIIQAKTLLPIMSGKDVIAQSHAGSGKTGAFLIGGLSRLDISKKHPQFLIIVNTRDLADQIYQVNKNLLSHLKDIKISLCIGGTTSPDVMTNLNEARNSHILIGTPGRLVDLIKRDLRKNKIKLLDRLKIIVLDEADKLLDDDFIKDIQTIMQNIAADTQVCLFSATFSKRILELTKHFMTDPVKILIEREKISVDKIKNYYVDVEYNKYKYDVLVDFYQRISVCQAIIFTNTVESANSVAEKLCEDGHAVGIIHAKLDDKVRVETLKKFRLSHIRILVATDIIARGIDVQRIGLVINYDVPKKPDQYIHRVGRSGRYGKLGVAITLVTKSDIDIRRMSNVEKVFKVKFINLPPLDNINNYLTGKDGYNFVETSNTEN